MFIRAQLSQRTLHTFGPFISVTVTADTIRVYEEGADDERTFAVLIPGQARVWESDDGRFELFEITA
jgi:hypothetical protein